VHDRQAADDLVDMCGQLAPRPSGQSPRQTKHRRDGPHQRLFLDEDHPHRQADDKDADDHADQVKARPLGAGDRSADGGHHAQRDRRRDERRHHGPARDGLIGSVSPVLTERVHRGDDRSGRKRVRDRLGGERDGRHRAKAHIVTARPQQSPLHLGERQERPGLGRHSQQHPPPAQALERYRRLGELALMPDELLEGECRQHQPDDVLGHGPDPAHPGAPWLGGRHAPASRCGVPGLATVSNASDTPSRPMVPVLTGATSPRPWRPSERSDLYAEQRITPRSYARRRAALTTIPRGPARF
jgi:hypothetical protein